MASVMDRPATGITRLLADSGEARQWVSNRTDLVTALLSVWFGVGLMIDAWAHGNLSELETFFTPWHAAFYSGFAAASGWILWQVWVRVRAGRRGLAAVPQGYGAAVIAIPTFAAFGAMDMAWHTFLGIEQNIDILFSPSHLGLVVSMLVIVTTPLRSAWNAPDLRDAGAAPTFRRMLPALLGIAFAQTLASLFLSYGSALQWGPGSIVWAFSAIGREGGDGEGGGAPALAASLVITTVLLITPLLLLARRWRMPFGTATVIFSVAILMAGAQTAFQNLPTLLGIVAAGVLIDVMALWLRPTAARRYAYWAYAGLGALVTWVLYIGIASVFAGSLPAVPELWTGAPFVSALIGLVLGVMFLPNAIEPLPLNAERSSTT